MTDLRQHAIALLEDALEKPPAELKAEVDGVERAVAALRDQLIERLRAAPDADVQASLESANAALSLIVGVEYPVGGIQRQMLEQARSALLAVTSPAQP
jgi:hypothetical protein